MAKEIKIDNVNIAKEKDEHGKVKIKKDGIDVEGSVVTLNDLVNLIKDPDVHIVTKQNPTCYWYWDGIQYRKYCW